MPDLPHQHSTYWRSLGELADTPEFRAHLEAEFPTEENPAGFSRRRMLQLMGASMVLATAASCRWKEREELPFAKRPENRTPGKFERYATAMELGGSVQGLLVTCVDGRPIKVEGNPKHPNSLGATNAFAQASILELYDPDRSRHIIEKTPQGDQVRSWEQFSEFAKKHFEEYRKNEGEGLAFLSESSCSPTFISLRDRFLNRFPKAQWCIYDPIGIAEVSLSQQSPSLNDAEVVLCIEDDIFGNHPDSVKNTRDFLRNRDYGSHSKRLYVVESMFSVTGAMADHRLSLPHCEISKFLEDILKLQAFIIQGKLEGESSGSLKRRIDAAANDILNSHPNAKLGEFFHTLAKDIFSHPGKVRIVVGERLHANAGSRSMMRELLLVLGNGFEPLKWNTTDNPIFSVANPRYSEWETTLEKLSRSMGEKKISSLWILGGNPVYNAPVDLKFEQNISNVSIRVNLSAYHNETSKECSWHLPQSHFLESWGDSLTADGVYGVQQPMIEPLHGGKSAIEILLLALDAELAKAQEEIRNTFKRRAGSLDFENGWRKQLHDGISVKRTNQSDTDTISITSKTPPPITINTDEEKTLLKPGNLENGNLEITFHSSPAVYDGRFANMSWLQEMPDPMTRLTWDNAAIFSPATAEKLGVKHEEIVKLKFKGREIEIPAYIMPGQADGSVAVTLGYGRTAAGKVGGSEKDGVAPVGVNTYKLRTSDAMYFGVGLTVEPTGRMHRFASVAEHFAIDKNSVAKKGAEERIPELVREMTVEEYRKLSNRKTEQPSPSASLSLAEGSHEENKSLWKEIEYTGHRWGMTIDLSKCVGCGTCVVACMAENNVPVVGKERIFSNREMHWLRIDRYFHGDMANPQVVFQPVMCQHCELAPCEGVCPVAATVHSKEGLNEMVYNRCVGTRYCANNCPYKVRRFNYFNYHKQYEDIDNETLKMASNPQVTVRMRGVMEKCSYCVQRIQAVKIAAKNEKREIADGEIKTACQQACPAGAIVFGDLSDAKSAVSQSRLDQRAYQLLGELNTKPRTVYLARVRNPNPEMEKKEQEK